MASAQATTILERLIDDDAVHEQLVAGGARIRDAYRRARRLPAHKAVQDPTLYDQLRGAAGALTEAARRLAGKPKPKPEPPRRARRLATLIGVAVTAGAFYFARRADQAASRQDAGSGAGAAPPTSGTTTVHATR
jgi:hypothetical protein